MAGERQEGGKERDQMERTTNTEIKEWLVLVAVLTTAYYHLPMRAPIAAPPHSGISFCGIFSPY